MNEAALLTLDEIKELTAEMQDRPSNRVRAYRAIRRHVADLEELNKVEGHNGYIAEKIGELLWHVRSLAGLDPGNGLPAAEYVAGVYGAVFKFRTGACFGPHRGTAA